MWNRPASAIAANSGFGSSRVCSISGAAALIDGASSRAASRSMQARESMALMGWIVPGRARERILFFRPSRRRCRIVERLGDGLLHGHRGALSPGDLEGSRPELGSYLGRIMLVGDEPGRRHAR